MFVMLRKDWPGNFRRTVTVRDPRNPKAAPKPLLDSDGNPRVLHFGPGEICELLDDAEAAAIAGDVGAGALIEMLPVADQPGKFRPADETRFALDSSPLGGEGGVRGEPAPPGPAGTEGSADPTLPAGHSKHSEPGASATGVPSDAAMLAAAGVDPDAKPDGPKRHKHK